MTAAQVEARRQAILAELRERGPRPTPELAKAVRCEREHVRQDCHALEGRGLVVGQTVKSRTQPRGVTVWAVEGDARLAEVVETVKGRSALPAFVRHAYPRRVETGSGLVSGEGRGDGSESGRKQVG